MTTEQTQCIEKLKHAEFVKFRDLIYRESGISLQQGKQVLLQSRLQKRLRALGIETYGRYLDYLRNEDVDGSELQLMINRVTTNKTHFFRENHHFEYLRDVVFASLIEQANRGERPKRLRIWSAACSSGEEPYTLAMTVRETFAGLPNWDLRILASDIDTEVLRDAETAIYHKDQVEDLDPIIVKKSFCKIADKPDKVQVRPELREMIAFRQINFADEQWPIHTKFDAIFCRNVLIYFDQQTQIKLVRRFADYLQPDGYLFIGHSESLLHTTDVYKHCGPTVFQLTDEARNACSPNKDTTTQPKRDPHAMPPSNRGRTTSHRPTQAARPRSSTAKSPNRPRMTRAPAPTRKQSLIVGDVFASEIPTTVTTTLGSCIATCLFDEVTKIGGMNHFALPANEGSLRAQSSFGVNAMELLINKILALGGARHRLKAKACGAAQILTDENAAQIGIKNEQFIRDFLEAEKIPLVAEFLGGDTGMQVRFETSTGRASVKMLDKETVTEANKRSQRLKMPTSDITLF